VLVACVVAAVEFAAVYLLAETVLSPALAGASAFLATTLGNLAWLTVRDRRAVTG
jgi:hypothetical protein